MRRALKHLGPALWAALLVLQASVARAEWVTRVEAHGASRTRTSTIEALLPRPLPADYDAPSVAEFERRLWNLTVFDRASVEQRGETLHVSVREKWTLIPDVAFATGKTLADLYLALGATEYNLLGLAAELAISAYREQRGFGFSVAFSEHKYRERRWAYGGAVAYGSAESRFDDGRSWYTTGPNLTVWTTSRPLLSPYFRYQLNFYYQRERIDDVVGDHRPPQGNALQLGMGFYYDRYRFHDLVARGVKLTLTMGPGIFVPAAQPRHYADLLIIAAQPLGRYTMLAARVIAGLTSRGNPNGSYLLGSIEGVRGLDDARYRNWAQSALNVELRQALPLFERLALQLVVFADVAAFERMDAFGKRADAVFAASAGGGVRVLPTFLAQFLFRFDLAYLLAPERLWFPQFGIAQYF